jgi:hypothetical protein
MLTRSIHSSAHRWQRDDSARDTVDAHRETPMGRTVQNEESHVIQGEGAPIYRALVATHDDYTAAELPGVKAAAAIADEPASLAAIGAWYDALPASPLNDARREWWNVRLTATQRAGVRRAIRGLQAL